MLDFRPVGASEVALFHHSFDRCRIAFLFSAPDVAATTASSFFDASVDLPLLGNMAAAESSSSMTIQPLEVERQRIRLIQRMRFMLLYIGESANLLELRGRCRLPGASLGSIDHDRTG
jgi:hypothetical protein